jgi:predicted dehydrogenase
MAFGVILVTGSLSHQEGYAAGFRADRRCRIVAVTDEAGVDARRRGLNQKLAGELSVPYVENLDDALGRPDVDLVSICTEHHRQGRVAIRCAEAGRHIYIDKPMAGNLEEARRLDRLVREKKLRSQMFTQIHYGPAQRARRLLQSGSIGRLQAIHCDLHFAKGYPAGFALEPRGENPKPELFVVPEAKREMFNIAVYPLAFIRWVTRRAGFRKVRAVTANYFFETNRRHDLEDFAVMALTMEGGVTATISSGRTGWRSHPGGGHHLIRLIGDRGSQVVDGSATRGELSTADGCAWSTPEENPSDPLGFWASTDQRKTGGTEWFLSSAGARSDQSMFLDCLEHGREAECTVSDGLHVLEALLGGYRSAASGDVVRLPLA